jgi:hypothetical protein
MVRRWQDLKLSVGVQNWMSVEVAPDLRSPRYFGRSKMSRCDEAEPRFCDLERAAGQDRME